MTTTVCTDTARGTCSCGWVPPPTDALRKAEAHARLYGHSITITLNRTITYTGGTA